MCQQRRQSHAIKFSHIVLIVLPGRSFRVASHCSHGRHDQERDVVLESRPEPARVTVLVLDGFLQMGATTIERYVKPSMDTANRVTSLVSGSSGILLSSIPAHDSMVAPLTDPTFLGLMLSSTVGTRSEVSYTSRDRHGMG